MNHCRLRTVWLVRTNKFFCRGMPSTLGWTIKKGIIVFLMKPSTFLWIARKGFQYFWLPLSSMRGTHPRRAFRYSWVKHKQWAWWPKPLHCDSRSLPYYLSTYFFLTVLCVCMSVVGSFVALCDPCRSVSLSVPILCYPLSAFFFGKSPAANRDSCLTCIS